MKDHSNMSLKKLELMAKFRAAKKKNPLVSKNAKRNTKLDSAVQSLEARKHNMALGGLLGMRRERFI